MLKHFLIISCCILLTACATRFTETKTDKSGYYSTGSEEYSRASTAISENINLNEFRTMAYVDAPDFFVKQTQNIGYFSQVLDKEELETKIIEMELQQKVPDVSSLIGLNNLYKNYKPFLYITIDVEKKGDTDYAQLIVKNPLTGKKLFVSEAEMDYVWKGVNDQNTFYPLFNSFIDWINANKGK